MAVEEEAVYLSDFCAMANSTVKITPMNLTAVCLYCTDHILLQLL